MKLRLSSLLLLLPALLSADPSSSSISSKKATYDGNALILNGDVQVEHTLGKMASGTARLEKEDKEGPFSAISLRDNVLITLKNLGKVSCANADFNFVTMTGKLLPEVGKLIKFVNLGPDHFSITSKEANMELAKESDSIKVVKINAEGAVQVQYGSDFFLDAEQATYTNEEVPYLSASQNCKLSHFADLIESEKVELFPSTSTAVLSAPKGVLHPSSFSKSQGMHFSCSQMVWENESQTLTLLGDISVSDDGIGELHCEDEIELRQKQEGEKWILSSMVAKGKTELTYELSADFKHLLICYGLLRLDQEQLTVTLESPQNRPIEYFHDKMKLCSDNAQLSYGNNNERISAEKLHLSGNVQLKIEEDGSRCATADQFTYLPQEEKMILTSKDGKNVLFWDKEQDLSISAREVHIARADQKETIKGVGNVRFAFSTAENDLLKKLFPFYQPEGKSK